VKEFEVVRIGIAMFPNVDAPAPGRLGRMIEDRGLESLWFAEHSHLPVEAQAAEGGGQGNRYSKTFDPFVAMTAASAATTTLKIGTGVCLVPQRDPIHTAKEVATVDVLSDGRVIFGVGAGWNRQEMRNHGTDPKVRMRMLTERVQAMIEIWTKDEAEYHGHLVDFDPLQAWPKPVQIPYPPIMVGGAGPTVEDRILAFGDGWAPMIADRGRRVRPVRTTAGPHRQTTGAYCQRSRTRPWDARTAAGLGRAPGTRMAPARRRWRGQRRRHRTIPR
jgi:probable F420-dependent oxidoreductase